MDGEVNGGTQAQVEQQEQQTAQQQAHEQQEAQAAQGKHAKSESADAGSASGVNAEAYQAQLAERDSRIAELEAQVAAPRNQPRQQTGFVRRKAALKQQGEDERGKFSLLSAGCRNVKAAKAVLDDHGGDVDALKAAEPWMFADAPRSRPVRPAFPMLGRRPMRASR